MRKFEFLEKARSLHGYKYKYLNLSDRITLNDKIEIEYNDDIYIQSVSKHLMGRCPEKAIRKKTTEEFILESKKIWGNKYDYSLTEYTGALNNIKLIHNGIVYEQRASSHLLGLSPEFRSNEESILRHLVDTSDEVGKKDIREFLNKYGFDFIENSNFNNLIFQFYLTSNRTVIEFRGEKHSLLKENDKKKEDYCEENYINFISIRVEQIDDIYKILYDNLKNYIRK